MIQVSTWYIHTATGGTVEGVGLPGHVTLAADLVGGLVVGVQEESLELRVGTQVRLCDARLRDEHTDGPLIHCKQQCKVSKYYLVNVAMLNADTSKRYVNGLV